MNTPFKTEHEANFSIAHLGAWADMAQHVFRHPRLGNVPGKVFLKEPLRLTGMEISLGSIPPGRGIPFTHRHRDNEEVYIFVYGRGRFLIDDRILEVYEGSVVRVATGGRRAWRNTGNEPLDYIVIQAKAGTLANGTISDAIDFNTNISWSDQRSTSNPVQDLNGS